MSEVLAVTPVRHGNEDGSVDEYEVGADLTHLDDSTIQALIDTGSAIEFGANKRYTPNVETSGSVEGPVDEATLRRDQLLARAKAETATETASGTDMEEEEEQVPEGTPPPAPVVPTE